MGKGRDDQIDERYIRDNTDKVSRWQNFHAIDSDSSKRPDRDDISFVGKGDGHRDKLDLE